MAGKKAEKGDVRYLGVHACLVFPDPRDEKAVLDLMRRFSSATEKSLVLLDEVGRGTSSLDGVAIATAVAEALHERRCYTLFATHYFELTALPLPRLKNLHVAAKEEEGGLTFYHQVLPGPASKSYGVEVARMAGLPKEVVERAKALLQVLTARREGVAEAVLEKLISLDPNTLTPLEALRLLHELKALALGAPLDTIKG